MFRLYAERFSSRDFKMCDLCDFESPISDCFNDCFDGQSSDFQNTFTKNDHISGFVEFISFGVFDCYEVSFHDVAFHDE